MCGVRNLEITIRFSVKSRPSERFHRPEMSQIKAEISLRTNVKLILTEKNYVGTILCYKNRESIDFISILHFYENSTSCWHEG